MPNDSHFIPTVFAAQALRDVDNTSVAAAITNSRFQGDISGRGDSVKVFVPGKLDAKDRQRGDRVKWQFPEGGAKTMVIDQEKDISFLIDDVDAFQSSVNLRAEYRREQAETMQQTVDSYVLGISGNDTIETAAQTADGFIKVVRNAKVQLTEAGTPFAGRYLAVTPEYADYLSTYFQDNLNARDVAENGLIGQVEGFNVYQSLGVEKGAMRAGHTSAITLARQIVRTRLVEDHDDFHAGGYKGLLVFGAQAYRPERLVTIDASGAGA